jgi:DNA repair exonuclease SbcCD nuclease subunit
MSVAKFLHAADLHLGAPLESLGEAIDSGTYNRIKRLVPKAFDRLIDVAIDEQVDFVVLAGDVYDNAEGDPGAQRRFLLGLRRLTDAGIKVFMVHGNHDPLSKDIKQGVLPEGVTVFPAGKLGSQVVTMRNGVDVTVAGVSYRRKEETDNLVPLFAGLTGRTIIGVLHTNVGGNDSVHKNYAPSTPAELEASPVHYWALGHIHKRSVNPIGSGWWAYPGNLQGRSVKASECGPKGALIVEVDDDGRVLEPRFVDCSTVRFERVSVPVDTVDATTELNDVVNESLARVVAEAEGLPVMVRLELTGSTDLADIRSVDAPGWKSIVESMLDEAVDVLGDGAVVKVRTSCRAKIDLAAERERKTVLAAVLAKLDELDLDDDAKSAVTDVLINAMTEAK